MHACRHCRFQTSSITTDNSLITTRYRSQWNSIWSQWPLITFYRIKFKDRLTDVISVWGVTFQTAFSTTGDVVDDSVEQRCFIRCSQNFFPPAWTTAWNSCVSFVEVTHRFFQSPIPYVVKQQDRLTTHIKGHTELSLWLCWWTATHQVLILPEAEWDIMDRVDLSFTGW